MDQQGTPQEPMEPYDPACPGCGKPFSEHELSGAVFAHLYDEIHTTMTGELGMPPVLAHKTLRQVLDTLFNNPRVKQMAIANVETGRYFWLRYEAGAIGRSDVMDIPAELRPALDKSPKRTMSEALSELNAHRGAPKPSSIEDAISADPAQLRAQRKARLN